MNYNGVEIHFWWLPFGQGLVINSKRCIVKPVKYRNTDIIAPKETCEVIMHELDHCAKIKRLGWLNFFATIIQRYITKGYSKTDWELDADKQEIHWNTIFNLFIIYCKQKNLKFQ